MDYYTGQIILWAGYKVPVDWAPCDGRLLELNAFQALYSLIGTTYGGDGKTNFALPNLQSRIPIGQGQGPGLTKRVIGSFSGEEEVALISATIPPHTHTMSATADPVALSSPASAVTGTVGSDTRFHFNPATDAIPVPMAIDSVSFVGSGLAHSNVMPSIGIQYIICLNCLYPPHP